MARFSGRQTSVGSVKVNGNKGVLRAFKEAQRELIEERRATTPITRTKAFRLGRIDKDGNPLKKTNKNASKKPMRRRKKKHNGVDAMAAILAKKFNSNLRMKAEDES